MDTVLVVLKCVGLFYLVFYSGLAVLVVLGTINDRRAHAAWDADRVPTAWVSRHRHSYVA